MISCKEATRLVSQGLDRRPSFAERARLGLHLAFCAGCANFRKQMLVLRQALRRLPER